MPGHPFGPTSEGEAMRMRFTEEAAAPAPALGERRRRRRQGPARRSARLREGVPDLKGPLQRPVAAAVGLLPPGMSRQAKEEYQRYYTVTEPRSHPKGHTEYRVTAKFVSKTNPEDVKEIVVWKRYSDFKKLHGDLAYTHRNLFRRLEDFPSFPKAQVFGRFDPDVIEERRKAAETMLRFTVHIPALNNSPQLKEFFRGGEWKRPLEDSGLPSLPPPLIPVPSEGIEPGEDALGSVGDQGLVDLKPEPCDVPEAAKEEPELDSEPEEKVLTVRALDAEEASLPSKCDEALDALFAFGEEEEEEEEEHGEKDPQPPFHCLLSVEELALFDPFSKEASGAAAPSWEEGLLGPSASDPGPVPSPPSLVQEGAAATDDAGAYLSLATERIRKALESEAAKDYQGAFSGYRSGVDLLLQGLQGDPDEARREAVKKKTAEYLQRAEEIFQQHLAHLEL